jgi:hypothetical protein
MLGRNEGVGRGFGGRSVGGAKCREEKYYWESIISIYYSLVVVIHHYYCSNTN